MISSSLIDLSPLTLNFFFFLYHFWSHWNVYWKTFLGSGPLFFFLIVFLVFLHCHVHEREPGVSEDFALSLLWLVIPVSKPTILLLCSVFFFFLAKQHMGGGEWRSEGCSDTKSVWPKSVWLRVHLKSVLAGTSPATVVSKGETEKGSRTFSINLLPQLWKGHEWNQTWTASHFPSPQHDWRYCQSKSKTHFNRCTCAVDDCPSLACCDTRVQPEAVRVRQTLPLFHTLITEIAHTRDHETISYKATLTWNTTNTPPPPHVVNIFFANKRHKGKWEWASLKCLWLNELCKPS